MPFQIVNFAESDVAEFVELDDKAMQDNPITQVMALNLPGGAPTGPFFQQ